MTGQDTARLILAIAGSTFARDSYEVLSRFQNLHPTQDLQSGQTLEEVLNHRIEQYPSDRNNLAAVREDPKTAYLPQIALEMFWAGGLQTNNYPPQAVMCWYNMFGEISKSVLFAPTDFLGRRRGGAALANEQPRLEALEAYAGVGVVHSRIVTVDAIVQIAEAMFSAAGGR